MRQIAMRSIGKRGLACIGLLSLLAPSAAAAKLRRVEVIANGGELSDHVAGRARFCEALAREAGGHALRAVVPRTRAYAHTMALNSLNGLGVHETAGILDASWLTGWWLNNRAVRPAGIFVTMRGGETLLRGGSATFDFDCGAQGTEYRGARVHLPNGGVSNHAQVELFLSGAVVVKLVDSGPEKTLRHAYEVHGTSDHVSVHWLGSEQTDRAEQAVYAVANGPSAQTRLRELFPSGL